MTRLSAGAPMLRSIASQDRAIGAGVVAGLGRGKGRIACREVDRQVRIQDEGELDDAEQDDDEEREDERELG